MALLTKPGLIQLKVENQNSLLTTQVNKINFTGSGVTASVGPFNDVTVLINGGGAASGVTQIIAGTNISISPPGGTGVVTINASSTTVSASYALSSSQATSASWAVSASRAISSSYSATSSYSQNLIISGSVNNVDYIDFNTGSAVPAWKSGRVFWDNTDGALSVYNAEQDITLQIGQENWTRVSNRTGATILNGTVVRLKGAHGDVPEVELAQSVIVSGSVNLLNQILGVATHDIEDNSKGFITTQGLVRGLNTNAFNDGDTLFVGTGSAGVLQNNAPVAPYEIIPVGVCVKASPGTSGIIYVAVQEPIDFSDLSSVLVTGSYSIGDIWTYIASGSTGVWSHTNQLSGSYGLTGSLNATSFTGSLFGTSSWSVSSSQAISSSWAISSSQAVSASYALSSSQATSASFSVSSSRAVSASFAISASRAVSASWAPIFPFTGSAIISGSLTVTGSTNISSNLNVNGDTTLNGTTVIISPPTVLLPGLALPYSPSPVVNTVMFDTLNNALFITSSLPGGGGAITSGSFTGSFSGSFTGSLQGTSSWSVSSSQAISSSWAISSSQAISASWAVSSSRAVSASFSISSSQAVSASFAVSSSQAVSASFAVSSSQAATSSFVNTLIQNVIVSGSLTVGNRTSTPASENTLNVYPPFAGGTGEGGQILLAASGGLYTSASMLDTWQDQFRILRGSNTGGSNAGLVYINLQSGNTQFVGAVTASAYSGLPNDYLYVTLNTNQTIPPPQTWANQDVFFDTIVAVKGIPYNPVAGTATLIGGKVYRITSRLAWSAASSYLFQYSCYDSANIQIGPTVEIVQSTNGSNNISDGTLEFIYAPGGNTDIKIRMTPSTSALSGEFIRGDLNTQLIIQQIA